MTEFDILNDGGISVTGDLLDVAINSGIIEKAGAFLKYQGKLLAQGREAVKKLFAEKTNPFEEIKRLLSKKALPMLSPRPNNLTAEEQKAVLTNTAIRFLSYRSRFKAEVVDRLAKGERARPRRSSHFN